MLIKKNLLITLILIFSYNTVHSSVYSYECTDQSLPTNIKNFFVSNSPGGKLKHLYTTPGGRYLVEMIKSGLATRMFAFYEDETGELWASQIDKKNKTETPFVKIPKNNGKGYKDYHPNMVKKFKDTINLNEILYHPKDMPQFRDYTVLDCHFGTEQNNISYPESKNFVDKKHHPIRTHDSDDHDSYDIHDNSEAPEEIITPSNDRDWTSYFVWSGVAGMLAIGYYYALTNVALCNRFLAREDTWSTWRSDESYETLLMIEPKYLADSLIKDINTTYYKEPNPIQLFLRDIAEEYDTICKWMQFRNTLRRFWLPLGRDFNTMENRLKLLTHMRKVAHYWRSQQLSIEE